MIDYKLIGIVLVLALGLFQSLQTSYLKDKVEKLETLRVYEKAIHDSNFTKTFRFNSLIQKIEKDYNEEAYDLNNTAIGDTINFGG